MNTVIKNIDFPLILPYISSMSKSILDKNFHYPSRSLGLCWEWPWNVSGGLLSWIYKRWSSANKDRKQIYSGQIIFGFKRITVTWDCDPPEAYFIHKQGEERMYKALEKLIKKEKEECCGKGCGCH